MPRFETRDLWSAKELAAGASAYSQLLEANDVGLTGFMSYQYDVTGSVKVTVERVIVKDSTDFVVVEENTHASAKGIVDVDLPLCKYLRLKITETTGSAGATVNKLSAVFG